MANRAIGTLFRAIETMEAEFEVTPWGDTGFRFLLYDERMRDEVNLGALMLHFKFIDVYHRFDAHKKKFPDSMAIPIGEDVELFWTHLKDVGLMKHVPHSGLEWTEDAPAIYDRIKCMYAPELLKEKEA